MGAVYLVLDRFRSDEPVAMKVLHPDLILDDRQTQRFMREVQLMRRVEHSNVVRTFEVGSAQEVVYFTMEYVPGRPLESFIEDRSFPLEQLANLIIQVCSGLEAIHRAGIIHRDLKPANIMVLDDFSAKITDFGVARPEYSELTAHNEIIGSALYIAPEIWLGTKLTPGADLYSLGVLLYELTTGVLPFDGDTPAQLMRMHLEYKPAPPKQLNPRLQPWLSKLIMWLLEKSAEDRPHDAREVIDYVKTQTEKSVSPHSGAEEFLASLEVSAPARTKAPQPIAATESVSAQEASSWLKLLILSGIVVTFSLGLFALLALLGRWLFPQFASLSADLSRVVDFGGELQGSGGIVAVLALQSMCLGGLLFGAIGVASRRGIASLSLFIFGGWLLSAIILAVLIFVRIFQYGESPLSLLLSVLKELVGILMLDSVVRVATPLELGSGEKVYLPDVAKGFFKAPLGYGLLGLQLFLLSVAAGLSGNLLKTLARACLLFVVGVTLLLLIPGGGGERSLFYLPPGSLPVYFLLLGSAVFFSRRHHRRA
jgi:serine/threonine protein kinase